MTEEGKFTPELNTYFTNICNGVEGHPLEYLSQFICSHLVGNEWIDIRKALLLMLLTQSDSKMRYRLHTLLVGVAGSGKTEVLLWWRENMEGILVNGELCSKTGLVGDARGNRVSAGLLADYDNHFVLVDEIDKMPIRDQNGLLQAMEEGQYIIIKGKHRQPFKAEVRVVGSTNELEKIQKPLMDRFDFIFRCSMANREERAEQTPKIVKSFIGTSDEEASGMLRGYIKWLGDFSPIILPDDLNDVIGAIQTYIRKAKEVEIEKVSYRSLEMSILRIAWAMAKLQRKNIDKNDVIEAIIFKDRILRKIYGVEIKRGQGL